MDAISRNAWDFTSISVEENLLLKKKKNYEATLSLKKSGD